MNNTINSKISAIILAAGLSSRMNVFKPLLPFGRKTMIEVAIDLFKANGIKDIVVVTGHNSRRLQPLISRSGAIEAFNNNYKSGMLSSIQKGVKSIRSDSSGFFLLPVDITAIRPLTIASMIKEFKKLKNQIIVPFFNDISGHPPLIPMSFKKDIFELKDGLTLRDVIFSKKVKSISLKVHDQG
ncbi:MAG: nucleotidyltransferase family protein, partial [Desulfobacteraceae bacterium]|nr:nucleotidyltransferase family protein [Desulfobacteraceae bacterium]